MTLDVFIKAAEDGTGYTDNEAMHMVEMNVNSYRARRTELEHMGWLKASGYYKKYGSNRRHNVWVLTPKGAEQAGLENYRPMMAWREDVSLIKGERKPKNLRRGSATPSRPDPALDPSPEELAELRHRNFLQECRVLIERSVLNFTKAKAPDITEFGAFLGNDGVGSPGFSPFELRQVAKYLERVSATFEANRARSGFSPIANFEPRRDI